MKKIDKFSLFFHPIDQFLGTLDALRDIAETTPVSPSKGEPQKSEAIESAFRLVPAGNKAALRDAAGALATVLGNVLIDMDPNHEGAKELLNEINNNPIRMTTGKVEITQEQVPTDEGDVRKGYRVQIKDKEVNEALFEMIQKYARHVAQPPKHHLVLSSLLVSAVSAFEVLITQLTTAYFRIHPDAVDGSEKEFSLNDLKALSSIEDAIEIAIERQVEAIGRGLIEWEKWFSKRLRIEFGQACIDWGVVQEIFQRRHVVVHNGGRVSKQYIGKTPPVGVPPKVGDKLTVSAEYAREALIQLAAFGASLGLSISIKLCPDDVDRIASHQIKLGLYFAEAGEWRSVLAVSRIAEKSNVKFSHRIEIECNKWLARKNLEGQKSIRKSVEEWDVSALQSIYRLYKLCLLDQVDEALQLLPDVLDTEELTIVRLRRLPIFAGLRSHSDFEKAVADYMQDGLEEAE